MVKRFLFKIRLYGQWFDREVKCDKLHTALHYLAEGIEKSYKPKQIRGAGLQIQLIGISNNDVAGQITPPSAGANALPQ